MSIDIYDLLRPGERIDLEPAATSLRNPEDEERKSYITKIYDINDDGDIEAFMPMEKTKLLLLPVGSIYTASFFTRRGIYGCDVKIKERYKKDALFILVLEQLTEFEKQQRREYYRYDCVIGMNTRELTNNEYEEFQSNRQFILLPDPSGKSVIVDISGGGMRFVSADKYTDGSILHCIFILSINGESRRFETMFRIIASQPVANNKNNTEYRGEFIGLSNVDRDYIVKYIFEQQRINRQKN